MSNLMYPLLLLIAFSGLAAVLFALRDIFRAEAPNDAQDADAPSLSAPTPQPHAVSFPDVQTERPSKLARDPAMDIGAFIRRERYAARMTNDGRVTR